MSAPSSPHIGHSTTRIILNNKGDQPEGLDILNEDKKTTSDGEVLHEREHLSVDKSAEQHFNFNVSITDESPTDHEQQPISRSTSATSSLDPYYFGIQSENESQSPLPPLPPVHIYLSTTPDHPPLNEPVTPVRNPAMIDRRGLVGVGELTTPRWAKEEPTHELESTSDIEGYDVIVPENVEEEDQPDSPWTIEAIDGESSDKEEVPSEIEPLPQRSLRTRPSIADESGGEEILYPRSGIHFDTSKLDNEVLSKLEDISKGSHPFDPLHLLDADFSKSPPSSFNPSARTARKRSSDEFEMDQTGSLVSKHVRSISASKEKPKDDKSATRKHRSLNISVASPRDTKGKEGRRDSVGLTINNNTKVPPLSGALHDKHVRQTSASSTSSNTMETVHSRRVHTTDFSRLPPSPSSSSIQQFLRNATAPSASQSSSSIHRSSRDNLSSTNVAHSILRGNQQEGWTPDEESIRKMDGVTGKTARARSSVGSLASSSRPGTPGSKSGSHWEGISTDSGKSKRGSGNVKERPDFTRMASTGGTSDTANIGDTSFTAVSSDEQNPNPLILDKTPKKSGAGARLSFTPKRGSTSSTTYTGTPSSRDSASMSATTSMTSISATSGRHSMSKGRRNSAGSDISSVHSTEGGALKDRGGSVGGGDVSEEGNVPPVPPLPKDLSNYRSPPSTSSGLTFPSVPSEDRAFQNEHQSRTAPLDVPQYSSPIISPPTSSSGRRESQYYSSANETSPPVVKTPSKKWSFSSALNLKLGSPSSSSQKSSFPLSPRAVTFGQQLRKSTSKEQATTMASSSANAKVSWSPSQPDAMASAGSLTSLSSVGSVRTSGQINISSAKTPDHPPFSSRSDAESTDYNSAALSAPPGPLSPSSSIRRAQPKRLTPSSIPFFRRSSSQSMQLPPPNGTYLSSSPPYPGITSTNPLKSSVSPSHDLNSVSTSTPGTTHKKTSMFSLLKSSSRRSLHSDAKDSGKESQKAKETVTRESDKEKAKLEKDQRKKDDKDRSESRISVIINRKRGKTLSSADPRKPKSPINLPPMQISALEPATAHRVAKLKSVNATPVGSSSRTSTSSTSSRLTSQTVSSLQKQSDTSLRSRNQLPTIAGSPSVGTTGTNSSQTLKDHREPALSSLANSASGLPKETPTKIPRISSRTSAAPSPATRRASGLAVSSSTNASPTSMTPNEFGVIENEDGTIPKARHPSNTVQASPAASTSRVPRQSMGPPTSNATVNSSARKNRESFMGLRKSSTNSVASLSTSATANESSASASTSHHRFSMLSPSKGLKLLAPKSTPKSSSSAVPPTAGSPSSSRQSLSTPSPVPSTVDEDELLGDEEMLHYIRRQHAKKLAAGATQEELDEMLKFPEPEPPTPPSTPAAILKSHQTQYLSEFEKKEILDYPSVYCIGANSKKKMAVLDNSTNNYGYDDERGDYLIVNHDHLAYRYEIIDTLGKGSFGQVLNCRDHVTGEAVAIKIIRNKKRFHHQALVEIKILDSLRKWDADEKHHVIKMNEHFYFRNHLCIAMELLSINLYELIKANGFVGFTTALIRRFTSQMLLSLSLMRHHRIVHCDLKPENVLLRHPAKSGIKVIDFGSSCFEHEKIYTYIQSRFYRSPEVILGMNYHMAIDMWSLGCILAELYTGFPIFPGENEQEQLSCIMEVLGVPDKEFINRSSRRKLFFDTNGAPRAVVNSKGRRRRPGTKTLAQVLRCNDEEFVDFVSKCLIWDPERRIKPQAALRHPFVTSGRRAKTATTVTKSTPSSSLSSRTKQVLETPKKSLISAPTPLTARSSRTIANGGLITPNNSHSQLQASTSMQTSTRTYRTSQTQSLSSFNSSRTLTGYISNTNK